MARQTMQQLQEENANLKASVDVLRREIEQRDQDFIKLEKTHEQVLYENGKLRETIDNITNQRDANAESLTELQKAHDSQKSMRDHYSREHDKAVSEVESIHAILDGVEGAPSRSYKLEENYSETKRSATTRLAGAFLAIVRGAK